MFYIIRLAYSHQKDDGYFTLFASLYESFIFSLMGIG